MAQVAWTPSARRELVEAFDFISRDNPQAARRLVSQIREAVDRLKDFPESGRRFDLASGRRMRELIVGNYRLPYSYERDLVRILRVIHGARRIQPGDIAN